MSRTGSGISTQRSVETSCMMTAIGKRGARSPGPIGCPVPGCNTAGGGDGRSDARLYQALGIFSSPSTYFFVVVMVSLPFFAGEMRAACCYRPLPACCICIQLLQLCPFLCHLPAASDVDPDQSGAAGNAAAGALHDTRHGGTRKTKSVGFWRKRGRLGPQWRV